MSDHYRGQAVLKEWKTELIEAGGLEGRDGILHYGTPHTEVSAAATGTVYCPLMPIGIIRASGADALSFLQGQLSNDLLTLANASQLSAYCTAQGRVIALFRIVRSGEEVLLLLPRELLASTLKRLTMFVLRANVTLSAADDWAILGLSGPAASAILTTADLPVPTAPAALTSSEVTVVAIPGPAPRYLLLGPVAAVRAIAPGDGATRVGSQAWAWLDIQSGLPTIGAQTTEAFVPQMLNLDLLDGINFRKGCYPGQEIVARTHYLGRLKQRMYRASLPAGQTAPEPGTSLSAPNLPGQPAGTIVDAQTGPDGQIDLLAVMQISSHDEGVVALQDVPLAFQDLPYPLAASC
ncbi:MAG TPA: hypothetical protein VMV40_06080 [Acidiferrobacter sp.]|nr:hypothetical protein [Acidiferrobacter sp.]